MLPDNLLQPYQTWTLYVELAGPSNVVIGPVNIGPGYVTVGYVGEAGDMRATFHVTGRRYHIAYTGSHKGHGVYLVVDGKRVMPQGTADGTRLQRPRQHLRGIEAIDHLVIWRGCRKTIDGFAGAAFDYHRPPPQAKRKIPTFKAKPRPVVVPPPPQFQPTPLEVFDKPHFDEPDIRELYDRDFVDIYSMS